MRFEEETHGMRSRAKRVVADLDGMRMNLMPDHQESSESEEDKDDGEPR